MSGLTRSNLCLYGLFRLFTRAEVTYLLFRSARQVCALLAQTCAPFALKRTGKLSHSLRHKKSRGFKRDFLWRREWDSNPRYACDVHTISNRAPSASSDISPRVLFGCLVRFPRTLVYYTTLSLSLQALLISIRRALRRFFH